MPDPIYDHPRLVAVYDALEGERSDLDVYEAVVAELGAERILDVGCGTGEDTLFFAREFPQARVRGLDISEEMIAAAQAKTGLDPEGRVAFKVGDAADLPYADDSFDLVAQLNMPPFFDEIVRVLRPEGTVIVAASHGSDTPFYTSPKLLRWKFAQRGVEQVETGTAGAGSYWVGRLTEPVASS
jgi:ubiquinone/menaquinone biosynthesis C-methylase UbiE